MAWLMAALLAQALASGAQTLVIETRLERTEAWEGRLELDDPGGLRLVALAVCEDAALTRAAAGIQSPWLVAGPLAPAGLLRLIEAPAASGPAGDVHAEATALRLDGSFDGGSRAGALAWPLPGRLGIGAFVRDGRLTAVAIAAGRPLPALRWEAVGARSAPPADPPGDEWFYERPLWPGGPLAHAAVRAMLAAGGIEACAAAGMSAAERAPPGGWVLLRLRAPGRGGSADLLLTAADGDARDTTGAPLRPLRSAALRAEARAGGLLAWAEASASGDPDALAAEVGAAADGPKMRLSLEAAVRRRDGGEPAWQAAARLESGSFAAEARRCCGGRVTAEACWKPGPLEIGARSRWSAGGFEEIEVGGRRRRGALDVDLSLGWSAPRPQEPLWISIGWSATVRLPRAGGGATPTRRRAGLRARGRSRVLP